ncbi:BON domain-containing protein [Streptomyces minutiscleroticus]|uniref:BON domain-containing protein n=1 Tax=Streptomyces minutiscleroticus TaxID=68238 RepID=A0A918KS18_9ACTN|nr:BON domain-containing protein [Streptomyces minutiscleroticus]GGX73559.1 hypothetical protein GCM10010358_30100 [Streptomyces minutiscleroticus]
MNEHPGGHASGDGTAAGTRTAASPPNIEYRIAHLKERLATELVGELGIRVEARGGSVVVSGTVPSVHCRDEIERIAQEELDGVAVHADIVVAEAAAPDHPEELA